MPRASRAADRNFGGRLSVNCALARASESRPKLSARAAAALQCAPRMALAPGTRLGPYEVIGPLGTGGMGEVYRASDARLGRDVAVKVLPATSGIRMISKNCSPTELR